MKRIKGNYTIKDTDTILHISPAEHDWTITLPETSSQLGRSITIVRESGSYKLDITIPGEKKRSVSFLKRIINAIKKRLGI